LITVVAGFLTILGGAQDGLAANESRTVSPDGSVHLQIVVQDGRLKYAVTFKGRPVIESSPLAISLDGTDITEGLELGDGKPVQVNEKFPWRGVHSQAVNQYNGVTVPVRHPKSNTQYTLEVRAFNTGVAFRHVIPGTQSARVPDEATSFTLPAGSTVWYHDLEGHYEAPYSSKGVADVTAGQWVAPPFTFKLPDSAGYASITEADLVNYSGMALRADGKRGFAVALGHKQHVSYPFRLRYPNDIERLSKPAAISGTITSPWRVVMVGADLNTLVNCDIVHDLCPPPDPKLFPQGMKTDWIKPGRAVWRYLDGGDNNYEGIKEFSRLAGELGFEYHVIENIWSRWSDAQLKELVDYSRERGVGLWLWRHSNLLRTPEAIEAFFKKLHDAGAVGAKVDFFDHEHKEVVDLYPALLESAARHRIMVNFHGANKPTGIERTWPNELIREGVRGMESRNMQNRARHNATLPFTRYLAGHGDYTPVVFGERRGDTTWAHQVATAAVFNEPLLTYGAHPKTLLDSPCLPMIKAIPAVWDETIVLPMSEIGEVAAYARRSGDTWFLAVLNGPKERTIRVPLSFLAGGNFQALVVRDQADNAAAIKVETTAAGKGDVATIELRAGGGFVAKYARPAN
jgi:alpha-glucosidase